MNRPNVVLAVAVVLALAASSGAQQPAGQPLAKLSAQVSGALARLRYTIHDDMLGNRQQIGQAICIDAAKGTFLTRDVPTNVPTKDLRDFTLGPARTVGEGLKAQLLGTDPEQGFAFLRALGRQKCTAVRFSRSAKLQLGQRVVSVGLLGPNAGNLPYLGSGYVGAVLRLPHQLVYVTGGDLTIKSSPVMTADGRLVGIVGGEVPMESRLKLGKRWLDVVTMGRQRTHFFLPVDEFAHVLAEIPTPGKSKRLPWTGILRFEPLLPKEAELRKLVGRPGVLVGQVVPNSPASKAGVLQSDAIVALNGKPLEELPTPALIRDNFWRLLRRVKPGKTVSLTIQRKGKEQNYSVKTEPMPPQPYEADRYYNPVLGLAVRDLVMLDQYGRPGKPLLEKGVRVFMVIPNSSAAKGQLATGDLVTHVNNKPVPSAQVMRAVLDPVAKPGSITPITFLVLRGDQPQAITVTPPPPQPKRR